MRLLPNKYLVISNIHIKIMAMFKSSLQLLQYNYMLNFMLEVIFTKRGKGKLINMISFERMF